MTSDKKPRFSYSLDSLRRDILASIVVFLVALPLGMGIPIAAGAPVASGLVACIVGGMVVAPISGSPLQVSGPAAGLAVVVYELIQRHGLEAMGIVVLATGGIQLLAGLLRLGPWFRAVSPAVVQGMLAGIGILIFASQFHVMVDDKPRESDVRNLITIPSAIAKGLPWPDATSFEERSRRSAFLKDFGQLHERQQEIEELVAERVTHLRRDGHEELVAGGLSTLAPDQKRLSDEVNAAAKSLLSAKLVVGDGTRAARLNSAALHAISTGTAALTALDDDHIEEVEAAQAAAVDALAVVLTRLKNHDWAAKVGLLTIGIIVAWKVFKRTPLRLIPAPLAAVAVVTVLAAWMRLPVLYVEVPDNLLNGVHVPTLATLRELSITACLTSALFVAVVASAQTLLCATAVDQMSRAQRTDYDRELRAQGLGNMVCGALGGFPIAGVIVRSAANVQSGARTRWSAFFHGLWILIFVAGFTSLLRLIPTASLAGILVYTGYKLFNPAQIRELLQRGKSELAIYAVTVATIVVDDVLTGVAVGMALSAVKLLVTFTRMDVQVTENGGERVVAISGAATFLRLPQLAERLEKIPAGVNVAIDTEQLSYIDHACIDLLANWVPQHESAADADGATGRVRIDWQRVESKARGGPRQVAQAQSRGG